MFPPTTDVQIPEVSSPKQAANFPVRCRLPFAEEHVAARHDLKVKLFSIGNLPER